MQKTFGLKSRQTKIPCQTERLLLKLREFNSRPTKGIKTLHSFMELLFLQKFFRSETATGQLHKESIAVEHVGSDDGKNACLKG